MNKILISIELNCFHPSTLLHFILFWQVSLLAYDQGFPSLVSVRALLIVNILRNQNPPVFINEPYSTTISQNQGTFQSIITVTATDADLTVRTLYTRWVKCIGYNEKYNMLNFIIIQ